MKILDNLMFNYIYDYISLYENNRNIYINSINKIIKIKIEEIITEFNNITNNFYKEINNISTK